MAKSSDYDIVTFQRKVGRWRASVTQKRPWARPQGNVMLSFVTDEDVDSEADAMKAANDAIKNLSS